MFVRLYKQYRLLSQPQQRAVLFCSVLLSGMLLTVLLSLYHLIQGYSYYPYIYFLFDPRYLHTDFTEVYELFSQGLQIYQHYPTNYLPFGLLLFFPLTWIPLQISTYITLGLFLLVLLFITYKWFPALRYKWLWTLIFVFASFPVLFTINRANIEMLPFMLLVGFLYTYRQERFYIAAIFLAAAISFKIYPCVFWILFVADKRFKALGMSFLLTCLFFGLGFWITGGNWTSFSTGFDIFVTTHQNSVYSLQFSHSLFNIMRLPAFFKFLPNALPYFNDYSSAFSKGYFIWMSLLFGWISLKVIFVKKMLWERVFLLTIPFVCFPFVSYDYTLINLLPAVLLFINTPGTLSRSTAITILTALVCIPMNIVLFSKIMLKGACIINVGSFVRPLLLIFLLVMLLSPFSLRELILGMHVYLKTLPGLPKK